MERSDADKLCQMSESILSYMPTAPLDVNAQGMSTHLDTIKSFYSKFQQAGFEPSQEMELFFNSIQIYESVMAISFVLFAESHGEVLDSIGESIQQAVGKIDGYKSMGCLQLTLCGLATLSSFNSCLARVDQALGKMNLARVAEFFVDMLEVFCTFFSVEDLTAKVTAISESLEETVKRVSGALGKIFDEEIVPQGERSRKWGPLDMTEKIRSKLSKFEEQAPVVTRTVNSFESLFASIEKVDNDLTQSQLNEQNKNQNEKSAENTNALEQNENDEANEDFRKVSVRPVMAQRIRDEQESALEQVNVIGRFFQHVETILSFGVLIFRNEEDLLNALMDEVDECTRILSKFYLLHPLYKVLCGRNYLSKLKVVVKRIVQLLEDSDLKINEPKEFLKELQSRYPNLLYLLAESVINDKIKNKLEILPDGVENLMSDALDSALEKFKDKFSFI